MTLQCLIAAVEKEREAVVRFFLDRLQRIIDNGGGSSGGEGERATHSKEESGDDVKEEEVFRAKLWALELACERGNARIVDDIIASGGIHLGFALGNGDDKDNDDDDDATAKSGAERGGHHYHDAVARRFRGLFRACEKGSLKIVTALLNRGLPVNMREMPAVGDTGADADDADVSKSNNGGGDDDRWTALHYAAKRGDLALVQKLVGRGADPSLRARFDGGRATPLDVAVAMDRDEGVVAYLRNITPRSSLLQRPEVVLTAAGGFLVVAVAYLLSCLGAFIFS
jgi:hypothetical protein